MATLKEIAKEAGTSVAVVSKVLNNSRTTAIVRPDIKKRILLVAKKLGYQPNILARVLVKGKTYTIGVVCTCPSPAFLSSFMASQIISGIWDKARKSGFFPSIEDLKGRVDGVIALGHPEELWRDEKFQEHLLGAILWAMGVLPGEATPRPKP